MYNIPKTMKYPKSRAKEVRQAIEKVKESTNSDKVLVSIQGLLSIIPHASGPLSYVLSEYRGRRNAERIFNALIELQEEIEGLSDEKRNILSEDEVVEIVQNTLEEIARTSSEEKVRYLRNVLTKAFTNDEIAYSEKQLYMSTLRDLSNAELELIREIYMSPDPFVQIQTYRKRESSTGIGILSHIEQANTFYLPTQYDIQYKEPDTGETLREVLQQRLRHLSEGTLEGLINSLDRKGLSNIHPNLEKRTVKIQKEMPYVPSQVTVRIPQTNMISIGTLEKTPSATPIEASHTPFGDGFIRYIQTKY